MLWFLIGLWVQRVILRVLAAPLKRFLADVAIRGGRALLQRLWNAVVPLAPVLKKKQQQQQQIEAEFLSDDWISLEPGGDLSISSHGKRPPIRMLSNKSKVVRESLIVAAAKGHDSINVYQVELAPNNRWIEKKVAEIKNMPIEPLLCPTTNGVYIVGGRSGPTGVLRSSFFLSLADTTRLEPLSIQTTHQPHTTTSAIAWADESGCLLLTGGETECGEGYSKHLRHWVRTVTSLPFKNHKLGVIDGSFYAFGGRNIGGGPPVRQAWLLEGDPEKGGISLHPHRTPEQRFSNLICSRWRPIPSMITPREHFAILTLKSSFILIGGSNGAKCLSTIEVFSPKMCQWKVLSKELNHPRKLCSVVVLGTTLVVLNGEDSGGKPVREIEVIGLPSLFDDRDPSGFTVVGTRSGTAASDETFVQVDRCLKTDSLDMFPRSPTPVHDDSLMSPSSFSPPRSRYKPRRNSEGSMELFQQKGSSRITTTASPAATVCRMLTRRRTTVFHTLTLSSPDTGGQDFSPGDPWLLGTPPSPST